ncbi:glycerol dehydrogenase [Haloprofundus marisrubri]|uniref:Glycerol dehydrogenase n=1 Tax=Haloprofundus marisrubri TaxID=1514971 RepID=A0A0W1R8T4_9EURY|nr:glycerol dehydrogenase [Haloprofundus marisrubri]KTG09771.1 glycerol dehydrogenase [Haloprofundus marisrubri]
MARVFKSPASYVQGAGVAEELGEYTAEFGESALLLADEIVLDIVEETATASLEDAGIDLSTVTFEGEASETEISRVTGEAEQREVDFIIGAGGGKTLDTAKAVKDEANIPVVSMPTVASTDAPTSSLSVIYSEHGEFERYRFYSSHPELVLVDTRLVAEAPTRFFVSGVGDALATWFEADATYQSTGTTIFGERPTRSGHALAELCYETLREHALSAVQAVERDAVTESVEAVTEANTLLSGLGFESGGLAAAHSVHNSLTQLEATHDATHGEKVNLGTLTQLVLEGKPDAFVQDIVGFSAEAGLPVTLEEIGLDDPSRDELDRVAEAACVEDETIHNEPFPVEPSMVRDALLTADALGRQVRDR